MSQIGGRGDSSNTNVAEYLADDDLHAAWSRLVARCFRLDVCGKSSLVLTQDRKIPEQRASGNGYRSIFWESDVRVAENTMNAKLMVSLGELGGGEVQVTITEHR